MPQPNAQRGGRGGVSSVARCGAAKDKSSRLRKQDAFESAGQTVRTSGAVSSSPVLSAGRRIRTTTHTALAVELQEFCNKPAELMHYCMLLDTLGDHEGMLNCALLHIELTCVGGQSQSAKAENMQRDMFAVACKK